MQNKERIEELNAPALAGELTPLDGVIFAARNCMARIMPDGGPVRGGAVGPQAQQLEGLLNILITIAGSIGLLERGRIEGFLAELPELYRASALGAVPRGLKPVFDAYGIAWAEPTEVVPVSVEHAPITHVRLVGGAQDRLVPIDQVLNKALEASTAQK